MYQTNNTIKAHQHTGSHWLPPQSSILLCCGISQASHHCYSLCSSYSFLTECSRLQQDTCATLLETGQRWLCQTSHPMRVWSIFSRNISCKFRNFPGKEGGIRLQARHYLCKDNSPNSRHCKKNVSIRWGLNWMHLEKACLFRSKFHCALWCLLPSTCAGKCNLRH